MMSSSRAEKNRVGFGPGTNQRLLTTQMENTKIADWWVTHVNGGEDSKLRVETTVSGPGFSRNVPAQRSTIETRKGTETVRLDSLSENSTTTTDVLGDE